MSDFEKLLESVRQPIPAHDFYTINPLDAEYIELIFYRGNPESATHEWVECGRARIESMTVAPNKTKTPGA